MNDVELSESGAGVLLPVQAQPGARRNGVVGIHAGRLKVAVTQAPEKGKANDAIIAVLAETLKLRRNQIALSSGPTSSRKAFLIREISVEELRARLTAALP